MMQYRELIIKIIQEADPYEEYEIDDETDFIEEEILDSLTLVYLVTQLETELGIEIDASLVVPDNFRTLSTMNKLIEGIVCKK